VAEVEVPDSDDIDPAAAPPGMLTLPSPSVSLPASPVLSGAAGGGTSASCSFSETNSATLTLVDLAGCEAASLNTLAAAMAQGVAVNKSLHYLRNAVHEIVAKRPPQFRNSALTRLLQPSLSGYACVSVLVTASERPGVDSARETLEAMQFGEAAGRVPIAPRRRTEVTASGHLSKLQALLDASREEKAEMVLDTASLQRQVDHYSGIIDQYKREFVSTETLREAEQLAESAEQALRDVQQRNQGLQQELHEEQAARSALQLQLAGAAAEAAAASDRSIELQQAVQETTAARHALTARVQAAKVAMELAQAQDSTRVAELEAQRAAGEKLRAQASQSEGELERQRAAAATLAAEVSAAQARNAALQGQLGAEHSAREAAACDLASAAAQVAQEVARSLALQSAVAEAEAARVELGRRMQAAREELEVAQAQSAVREEALRQEQEQSGVLQEHVVSLEARVAEAHVEVERAYGEKARWHDLSQAKGDLLLLKHKLHRERIGSRSGSPRVSGRDSGSEPQTPPMRRH